VKNIEAEEVFSFKGSWKVGITRLLFQLNILHLYSVCGALTIS